MACPCKDMTADTCWMERTGREIEGAVTGKAGYTLHCMASTVALQDACEMGLWWPRVSAKNLKSIWSFWCRWTYAYIVYFISQLHFIFTHYWIHIGLFVLSELSFFSTSSKSHNLLKYIFLIEWTYQKYWQAINVTLSVCSAFNHWMSASSQ